jgi:protein TonB
MFDASNLTGFAGGGRCRLPAALAGSLAVHLLLFGGVQWIGSGARPAAEPAPVLQATLAPPLPPAAPVLIAPEAPAQAASPAQPARLSPPRRPAGGTFELADPATQALRQVARNLLYPPEAVARGLEGEATVTLFLDETGNAVAARLERTSGHAVLDDAAVRAARGVRALPGDAPREVLLPVRFKLK